MGYFLQKAERDYIMLERSNVSGMYAMLSINNFLTKKTNVQV